MVAVPSRWNPLPAVELYRILECSDIPAGVWNLVTGKTEKLTATLAGHHTVAAIWQLGKREEFEAVQQASAGNLKQTRCAAGDTQDGFATPSTEFLRRATQVKNIWVPFGA